MKHFVLALSLGLLIAGCQSPEEVADAEARVGIPQNYQPEPWPPVDQLDDDLLIKHYFEVKKQRMRQADLIETWDEGDGHPENIAWHKDYLSDVTDRERELKAEMKRRRLSYNIKNP